MPTHLSQADRQYLEQLAGQDTPPTERQKAIALLGLAQGLTLERVAEEAWIRKEQVESLAVEFDLRGLAGVGLSEKTSVIPSAHEIVEVTIRIAIRIQDVKDGGYWANVPDLPGCVAQAETRESLLSNIKQAIQDWFADAPMKTEQEAVQLTAIQGGVAPLDRCFPVPNEYLPPPSWSDEDE